jgi:hypothetical protein
MLWCFLCPVFNAPFCAGEGISPRPNFGGIMFCTIDNRQTVTPHPSFGRIMFCTIEDRQTVIVPQHFFMVHVLKAATVTILYSPSSPSPLPVLLPLPSPSLSPLPSLLPPLPLPSLLPATLVALTITHVVSIAIALFIALSQIRCKPPALPKNTTPCAAFIIIS